MISFDEAFSTAGDFVNWVWPFMVVPVGIVLGIGILDYIVRTVRLAVGHGGH